MPNRTKPYGGITRFVHCRTCINEFMSTQVSRGQALNVGYLPDGRLRVWCNRHAMEVATFEVRQLKRTRVPGNRGEA